MSNNLKDIFSYRSFSRMANEGKIDEEELNKLESLILLMQYSSEINEGMRKNFVDTGLSQNKYYILLLLNEKRGELMTPSEISEFLSVSRGTISDLVDSMEKDGLVERVICKDDRRKIQVIITEKGREISEGVIPRYYSLTSDLMACLTVEEVNTLVSIVKKLSGNMKKIKGEKKK